MVARLSEKGKRGKGQGLDGLPSAGFGLALRASGDQFASAGPTARKEREAELGQGQLGQRFANRGRRKEGLRP
jgi:hypothetical protein